MSLDELIFFLRKLFLEADVDRNGVLDQKEFGNIHQNTTIYLHSKLHLELSGVAIFTQQSIYYLQSAICFQRALSAAQNIQ